MGADDRLSAGILTALAPESRSPGSDWSISYKNLDAGYGCADIIVEHQVLLELKRVDRFSNEPKRTACIR